MKDEKKSAVQGSLSDITPKQRLVSEFDANTALQMDEGKYRRMFRKFAGGARIHRTRAEELGDHALPTTVSDLQKRYGVHFERRWVKIKNRFGTETRLLEYRLDTSNRQKARQVLGMD